MGEEARCWGTCKIEKGEGSYTSVRHTPNRVGQNLRERKREEKKETKRELRVERISREKAENQKRENVDGR